MRELAKRFIGKECIVTMFDEQGVVCVIKEVTDNGMLIEKKNGTEVLNLDFVLRIQEYPTNKKGKKKAFAFN